MYSELKANLVKTAPEGNLLIIPVNAVGVAGKGLALYMKMRFKLAHKAYVKACRKGSIATGDLLVVEDDGFQVALFPTKYNWRDRTSDLKLIAVSLQRLKRWMETNHVETAHLPKIGCGKGTGNLDYQNDVKPLIEEVFGDDPNFHVYVYSGE